MILSKQLRLLRVSTVLHNKPDLSLTHSLNLALIEAWLNDLRHEEERIAAIVPKRFAAGPSTPLPEVAHRLGVNFDGL